MAFKTAAIQAFKKGVMEAGPVLLEPIMSLKVTVPDAYTGDIMGVSVTFSGRYIGKDWNLSDIVSPGRKAVWLREPFLTAI